MKFGRLLLLTLFTLVTLGLSRGAHADPIFPTETYCGDGTVNTKDEACDDGNNVDGDGCDHLCQSEMKPIFPTETYCGDGAVNTKDEACDDGNNVDGDGCDHLCAVEAKAVAPAPEEKPETHADGDTIAAIVNGVDQATQDSNAAAGQPASMGGWSCSMVETSHPSSPLAYGIAFLLLLSGVPALLRKRK